MADGSTEGVAVYDLATAITGISCIATRRKRIPAYEVTGVGGRDDDHEPTQGQIWPR